MIISEAKPVKMPISFGDATGGGANWVQSLMLMLTVCITLSASSHIH